MLKSLLIALVGVFHALTAGGMPTKTMDLQEVSDVISVPRYPRMAIATGQSGTVKVRVKVFEDGTHRIESVVGKDRFLKDGVVKAVESWKFMKGYPDGLIEVEFSFVLLPHTASESELVTEIYPELNRMIIKSRAAGGLKILDPPALPN